MRVWLALVLAVAAACSSSSPVHPRSAATTPQPTLSDTPSVAPSSPSSSPLAQAASGNVYAATAVGRFSPVVAHDRELVYVPESTGNTVEVIDPNTLKVIGSFFVGHEPQHVTPSWDLTRLYVDGAGTNTLTVVDPRTGKPSKVIQNITDPYNLYFTPDGTKAVVVAEDHRRLDFRDPTTWKIIRSVAVPWPGVDHLDFTADGHYLLASTEYSGRVVKVDVQKMAFVSVMTVGGKPIDVRLSPDGKVLFVANQGLGGVSVVDPDAMRQLAFIPTGRGAHGLAVSRDAKSMYVSNRLAGTVSVVNVATRHVSATWHVGGSPDMLQVSPDGKRLWLSNRFTTTVSVIDTITGAVIARIKTGSSPHGLCYFPQPGRYSVGHNGVYR